MFEDVNDPFAVDDEDHTPADWEVCNYCGQLSGEMDDEGACPDCADEHQLADEAE